MKRASASDIPQLVGMLAEFYAESDYTLNRERAAVAFTALFADDHLGSVWILESDDQAAGYLILTYCFSMEYGGLSAFVDDLFVRPSFRGRGLATAALLEAKAYCTDLGIRAMHVETGHDNAPAHAVYRLVGFIETDRTHLALKLASPTHEE